MKNKKELIEMRKKLVNLHSELKYCFNYYKPTKRFFGFLEKGDLSMASTILNHMSTVGTQIHLINWILEEKEIMNFDEYTYGCLKEATKEWVKEIKDKEKQKENKK